MWLKQPGKKDCTLQGGHTAERKEFLFSEDSVGSVGAQEEGDPP